MICTWIAKDQAVQVGLILLAVPFVLQVIAAVLAFLARDGAAGSALGVPATSWLAIGLVHISSPTGHTSGAPEERRPVLLTFRRGRGRVAVLGTADTAIDEVLHEPGVRQTT